MKHATHLRQSQSPEYAFSRRGPFNPFSELSGIRPASEDTSLLASTAASFLYQPSKSESAGDRWVEEDVCLCKECRGGRPDLSISELQRRDSRKDLEFQDGEREPPPSFRASPKFQDVPSETTQDSLATFLAAAGLQSLLPVMQEHEVALQDLFLLTREDLADMKIPIGPRNRLLSLLQKGPSGALNQSKTEVLSTASNDPELDSPKQHSAPSVKPATPEKHPQRSAASPPAEPSFQQHRRQLNEEVESFMQELDELLTRTQRKKPQAEVPEPSAAPAAPAVSQEHMEILKTLLTGREELEKGLESMKRSISEMKENRTSRDASPIPKTESFKGASISPKTKVPLNMKRGLINRLK